MNNLVTTPPPIGSGLADLIEGEDGTPRVLDTTLAQRLGYTEPRMIRKLIKRHLADLAALGVCDTASQTSSSQGGRPSTAYYLTEAQAVFIVAKSRTTLADSQLVFVSQVFTEFSRGNLRATDGDTQARLDTYEADRERRLQQHIEEKEARSTAFKFLASDRRPRPKRCTIKSLRHMDW